MPLTFDEELRYSRHLILPGVGLAGQERLKRARVLLVGAGGLGSPVALYLAAAGVGTLAIADADTVDVTNLHRQVLHRTTDVGRPKVESAHDALDALNPLVNITPLRLRITAENARELIATYDVVVDGTDNFPTRYLLNDACALLGKPLVFGSIFRFAGQVTVFDARRGPCYRCLFPEPPAPESVPTCAEGGVLGVLPGLIGMIQATETLKLLLDLGESLIGRLLMVDAETMRFREVRIQQSPDCPLCGVAPSITELMDYQAFCGVGPRTAAEADWEITPDALRARLAAGEEIRFIDIREEHEQERHPGFPAASLIPYPAFSRRMTELESSDALVLYCSTGARSWQAVRLLRQAGFSRACSLQGGLAAFFSSNFADAGNSW
ncbi:MAG TPA: molybdopterin-synthase adenylyltransferase MoeB [Armatimonadota bacterium]|jgi:adenylyltransferase/sulfurtransferase